MSDFYKIDEDDVRVAMLDGKLEPMVTVRGVLQLAYLGWTDERLPKCEEIMRRYCQYISMRGYKGGATNVLNRWKTNNARDGMEWLKSTFEQYVSNENDMMQYVMAGIM